jgi:hypothetical protein
MVVKKAAASFFIYSFYCAATDLDPKNPLTAKVGLTPRSRGT